MRPLPLFLVGLCSAAAAQAQAQSAEGRSDDADSLGARITAAAALPALAQDIRGAGVPQSDLAAVMALLAQRRVPATDAKRVLDEEWKSAREHGPVPGLGVFVRGRLDEGLRGRALADAIRQEHARRGTGGDQGSASRKQGVDAAPGNAEKRKAEPRDSQKVNPAPSPGAKRKGPEDRQKGTEPR